MNETKRSAHWRLQTSKLNWRLQTRKPNSLHGNKWSKAILYLLHLWPLDNGSCRPESVQALEAEQNPRLTAKEMTATQKRYPKQTHASEGAVKFCANHRGRRTLQLEISSSSLRTRIAKPLLEPTSKRSMLKQTVLSSISWNQAIKNSRKDHLFRENSVMPSTAARIIVTKCTPKCTIE